MLLDTCVVIDVLRGRDAAIEFVSALPRAPAVSAITATEVIAGCRSSNEQRQVDQLLSHYTVIDLNLEIASLAADYARQYGPSHATDPIDAVIAATAKVRMLSLATLNLKHFPMVPGLKRPYGP